MSLMYLKNFKFMRQYASLRKHVSSKMFHATSIGSNLNISKNVCNRTITKFAKLNISSNFEAVNHSHVSSSSTVPFSSFLSSSRYFASVSKGDIEQMLSKVNNPENNADVLSSNLIDKISISESGDVSITLKLNKHYRKIKKDITANLFDFEGVNSVNVKMDVPKPQNKQKATQTKEGGEREKMPGLKNVKNIIAVSSCKGGVGKSTVAVNLAYTLKKMNFKVGIFDADVYGPSLPTLVSPNDTIIRQDPETQLLFTPIYEGVKTQSYGYVLQGKGEAATLRGPMVSSIVTQLAEYSDWGELDFLLVDLPPGTGDIQITLAQRLKFNGAVIITTPQKLAVIDVVKGIDMFNKVKVPILSVVENMAYFECDGCSKKHYPFGPTSQNVLKNKFGISKWVGLPMLPDVTSHCDSGFPMVLDDDPSVSKWKESYINIAKDVTSELEALEKSGGKPPIVTYEDGNILVSLHNGEVFKINAAELRRACKCASCVEEFTGRQLLNPESVSESIKPLNIEPLGNYAVAVHWDDNHRSSIYPYDRLVTLGSKPSNTES